MATVKTNRVQMLSSPTNFNRWKFQLFLVLDNHDVLEVVTGDTPRPSAAGEALTKWIKLDKEARSIIASTLSDSQIVHIYECTSAKAMFDTLKSKNSDSSELNQTQTYSKFINYKMKKNQCPLEAMREIQEIAKCLEEIGMVQTPKAIIMKIVSSLPAQFRHFKTAWQATEASKVTLENLENRLKMEVNLMQEDEDEEDDAPVSRAFRFNGKKDGARRGSDSRDHSKNSKIKCHYCDKLGHIKRDCRKRIRDEQQGGRNGMSEAGNRNFISKSNRNFDNADDEGISSIRNRGGNPRRENGNSQRQDKGVINGFVWQMVDCFESAMKYDPIPQYFIRDSISADFVEPPQNSCAVTAVSLGDSENSSRNGHNPPQHMEEAHITAYTSL